MIGRERLTTTSGRGLAILGAPSSIGIRPYDDGTPRRLDLAPNALRSHDLGMRLPARDRGDVLPPPYREWTRPAGRPRHEAEVAAYSRALAEPVAAALTQNEFLITLGGDCSILLGCLLGLRHVKQRIGLLYVDAHADFATPTESRTGSVASMCLALAVGRGDTPLARLHSEDPLVRGNDVVLIGRRDQTEAIAYGQGALQDYGILDMPQATVRALGVPAVAATALERLTQGHLDGFWIHVDADVLDPAIMPAVDSPVPGGLGSRELADLLVPLVRNPSALGIELTIYDPALDPDRSAAGRLADLLVRILSV